MFGKKVKETMYTKTDLYAVKEVVDRAHRIEEMFNSSTYGSAKDYTMAIELCNDCMLRIDNFSKQHPELVNMFAFEAEVVKGFKKMFYLRLERLEKSAE